MSSVQATEVAKEVVQMLGKSRKIVLRKIAVKNGYSQSTADTPKNITETKSFKKIVGPVVDRWIQERERVTEAMENTSLDAMSYQDLIRSLDILTKNIQLLGGSATGNIELRVKRMSNEELQRMVDAADDATLET